ncbi:MAG: hypothetical protein EOO11_19070 [Chitinophagaceae bacterium]|nr:MAG: hypothetical protein EOO11_19070 [Chitinophagaceae bacterium]
MNNENLIGELASRVAQDATVKHVFGDPIRVGDKTIIPVARITYGFGGGSGAGSRTRRNNLGEGGDGRPQGEGAGGGGGIMARPRGVYEVSARATRFVPTRPFGPVLMGVAIGFLLRGLLRSRR